MKSVMNIVMLVATVMAVAACGKKGGASSPAAAGPSAAGACSLNAQNTCVGGVNVTGGLVLRATWDGNVGIVNQPKYLQFLNENQLCYGVQCARISGFFRLKVQTVGDQMTQDARFTSLPNAVNFALIPRFGGYQSGYQSGRERGGLSTQADGYINAAGNGFQLVYNRLSSMGFGGGFAPPTGVGFPSYGSYGVPQTQIAQNLALQIVLTYADATQTVANVSVSYQGTQFASGQLRALIPGVNTYGSGGYSSGGAQGAGPAVVPYQGY